MILSEEQKEKANKYLSEYARLYNEYGKEMMDADVSEEMIDYEIDRLIKQEE